MEEERPQNGSPRRPSSKHGAWATGPPRRRLIRRSGIPRSQTTPDLSGGAAPTSALSNNINSVPFPRPALYTPTMMSMTGPTVSSTPIQAIITPRSKSPTRSTKSQKKKPIFPWKTKEHGNNHSQLVLTSPLPFSELSPKAARLLGVAAADGDSLDNKGDPGDLNEIMHEEQPSRTSQKQSKFKEESIGELSSPVSTSSIHRHFRWNGKKGKKTLRMLDIMPSRQYRSKSAESKEDLSRTSSPTEQDVEIGYSSDSERDIQPSSPKRSTPTKRRIRRKRIPKRLDKMSPITEASMSDERSVLESEHAGTELEVISEYAGLRRSVTEPVLRQPQTPNGGISSNGDSGSEDGAYDDQGWFDAERMPYRYAEAQIESPTPGTIQAESPLQHIERVLLDNAEQRSSIDSEKESLKEQHAQLKEQLRAAKARSFVQGVSASKRSPYDFTGPSDEAASDDPDDDFDIDIDSDEGSIICIAKTVTFTRVAPGMVKLMDIPPKRPELSMIKVSPGQVKSIDYNNREGFRVESLKENMGRLMSSVVQAGNEAQGSRHAFNLRQKPILPRTSPRELVEGWLNDYNPSMQRPLSERIDPEVLADQDLDLPPRPPPKNDTRHDCLLSGHFFKRVDIRGASDDVRINKLEVSPYLQTRNGVRQHVHIPIACELCGLDVGEELFVCSVPVCRLSVCSSCTNEMKERAETRAIKSWGF
ncbi:hypothetical protein CC78DRAFT_581127 [Lojkania enalia]|uniref:Uncharacterized protein n=1 Tax=Lojkania enalia TaxID=147567 RepID=A0A9P4N3N0_9PLEO|nr:hypothetical protein CC78DRAFT_581127 [Didymosphaeria enalia]